MFLSAFPPWDALCNSTDAHVLPQTPHCGRHPSQWHWARFIPEPDHSCQWTVNKEKILHPHSSPLQLRPQDNEHTACTQTSSCGAMVRAAASVPSRASSGAPSPAAETPAPKLNLKISDFRQVDKN